MAKKDRYEELANKLPELVGGNDNISYFAHCVTRLRFNVKDKGKVDIEEIKKLQGVLGAQWSGDQLQVVIGQSVGEVYDLVCEKAGLDRQDVIDENLDGVKKKKGFKLNNIFDAVSGCITPIMPMLAAGGMLKGVLALLSFFAVIDGTSTTYQILSFAADASFYFLPIAIGVSGAKKFKVDISIGVLLGGILIHPTFVSLVSSDTPLSFLGIPVYGKTYGSTIIPMILTMWICGYVERFLKKHVPAFLQLVIVPVTTVLIMTPLMLCILGPVGAIIGDLLVNVILGVYNAIGLFAVAIVSAVYPLLVLTGMHSSLAPVAVTQYTATGSDPIMGIAMLVSNTNQGIATLAVSIKEKNSELKASALALSIPCIFSGITEPCLFGINFRYKTPLIAGIIGNIVGGFIGGLLHVARFAPQGGAFLLSVAVYFTDDMKNFVNMLIAVVAGCVVTFIATLILYHPTNGTDEIGE